MEAEKNTAGDAPGADERTQVYCPWCHRILIFKYEIKAGDSITCRFCDGQMDIVEEKLLVPKKIENP